MVSSEESVGKGESRRKGKPKGSFKGVRMRKWGRWVSEIRIPKTRSRIWLGSYDAPEKAARAYDAALYCLRGPHANFNFASEKRPEFPGGMPTMLTKTEIKTLAARFASSEVEAPSSSPVSSSSTPTPATQAPASSEAAAQGNSSMSSGFGGTEAFLHEQFLLGDPIMFAPGNIWDII